MRMKYRRHQEAEASLSCSVKEGPLLGGAVLHWRFGVALKVFIVTALTITTYFKQCIELKILVYLEVTFIFIANENF